MFNMMNEARISVGLIATSLGYLGYSASLNYARERRQGRSSQNRDASSPQTEIINHADVKRMLLAQKAAVEGSLALCLYASLLVDRTHHLSMLSNEDIEKDSLLLDLLTPIVKSWPSEWCLEANKWAIQVHGGYGYTRDYVVEQAYRDNRLNMIHEGTNGIQSLDLLGRKVRTKGFSILIDRILADVREAMQLEDEDIQERARSLQTAVDLLCSTRDLLVGECREKGDISPDVALANSHEFLNMSGNIVIAWMWLRQEKVAATELQSSSLSQEDQDFYLGKRKTAQYFFRFELPKVIHQSQVLTALDQTNLEMKDEWF